MEQSVVEGTAALTLISALFGMAVYITERHNLRQKDVPPTAPPTHVRRLP